jgi:uncharacterized protein (DUF2147 family)
MKRMLFLTLLLLAVLSVFAENNPDAILGIWENGSGKGYIQIYKQNGRYYGKITWLKDAKDINGRPKTDRKNQDPSRREKPLIGLVMLRDFKYEDGEWTNGHIYNPSDGKEYKGYMKLIDKNTLEVRGYIGFSWIGKTDTWTRVRG